MTDTAPSTPDCPVCGSRETESFVEKSGFKFRNCPHCGYIFCHPRPTQAELALHYGGGDGEGGIRRDHYPKASSRRRRGFFTALKLVSYFWGKRALDVGAGGGFVVGAMKTLGARDAQGLDINPNAVEYARAHFPKCEFHLGTFDDFSDGRLGQFGFVYSSEVIEHVEDVEAYVRFLSLVAEPGAAVYITTPDIANPSVPAAVTAWDVFSPPLHIQFFTEASLARLFSRFGFSVIRRVPDRGQGLKMLFRKTA